MAQSPQKQTAVQTVQRNVQSILQSRKALLAKLMQSDARAERLILSGLIAVAEMKDKEGKPCADQCDPVSIARAITQAALLSIDLTAGLGEGWLIKYGDQCTLSPGYRSWQRAAQSAGYDLAFDCVREGDTFEITKLPPSIRHSYGIRQKEGRGAVIGAYAAAHKESKLIATEWCDLADLDAAHAASKSPLSPAWKNWEDRMQRKLPLVRLVKDLPIDWTGRNAKLREVETIAERGGGLDTDFDTLDAVIEQSSLGAPVPQPEGAPQGQTAKLLDARRQRVTAVQPAHEPAPVAVTPAEPPHDARTGEITGSESRPAGDKVGAW